MSFFLLMKSLSEKLSYPSRSFFDHSVKLIDTIVCYILLNFLRFEFTNNSLEYLLWLVTFENQRTLQILSRLVVIPTSKSFNKHYPNKKNPNPHVILFPKNTVHIVG